ncbi:TetR/AcrR family transcriptional regulator [Enterococcus sp. 669A]|uniref:TetR/AcrR family transcriptional regulator n=1 Tax=Candidatus Enterococcus moelleringii TaxID=2815325 RepID=A0ABS3LC35_9ENTE|nr:TetR/AcrR family transcriptional regulator [Enterococcus sp. 669A]MBO1307195.1 TetR/AcrR family transcriptional regulator [Enterococcus sp. 669A]
MRKKDFTKRDNIIQAAMDLINERGFSDTPMSQIAKKANVSAATIYVYFDNKEDLINKLYFHSKKKMRDYVMSNYDENATVEERYKQYLRKFIQFLVNNQQEFLFIDQFQSSPLLNEEVSESISQLFQQFHSIYDEGKETNVFKNVDTTIIAGFTINPAMQFVRDYHAKTLSLTESMIDDIIQMSWDAVKYKD